MPTAKDRVRIVFTYVFDKQGVHLTMTLGERRVRLTFNPGNNPQVDKLKRLAADLIDECETMKDGHAAGPWRNELIRLLSLAQTHAEDAAMWAVKAATTDPEPAPTA